MVQNTPLCPPPAPLPKKYYFPKRQFTLLLANSQTSPPRRPRAQHPIPSTHLKIPKAWPSPSRVESQFRAGSKDVSLKLQLHADSHWLSQENPSILGLGRPGSNSLRWPENLLERVRVLFREAKRELRDFRWCGWRKLLPVAELCNWTHTCLKKIVILNKTGLQPVSRPVEQSFGFFRKVQKQCKQFKRCGAFGTAKPVSKSLETEEVKFGLIFMLFGINCHIIRFCSPKY